MIPWDCQTSEKGKQRKHKENRERTKKNKVKDEQVESKKYRFELGGYLGGSTMFRRVYFARPALAARTK